MAAAARAAAAEGVGRRGGSCGAEAGAEMLFRGEATGVVDLLRHASNTL